MPAALPHGDLLAVDVPRQLWRQGGRPIGGTVLRFGFGATFLVLALAIPDLTTRIVFIVAAVAVILFANGFMDRRLEALGVAIGSADRARAARLLADLDKRRVVALFAPAAWLALQRGRLHLRLGNERAAAKAFADCGRLAGQPQFPAIVSGQVHALTLAGDRKEARALLAELESANMLSDRDRLDYGIVLLEDTSKAAQARTHLERAYAAFGGHPRVLAGLALALLRTGEADKGVELLKLAEDADDLRVDELAGELVKRARKVARPILEAQEKRARKQRSASEATTRVDVPARVEKRDDKRDRKDRRKERREKRRAGKDAKPSDATPVDDASHVAEAEAAAAKREAEAAAAKREAEAAEARRAAEAAEAKREAEAAEAKREAEAAEAKREAEAAEAKREAEAAAARAAAEVKRPTSVFVPPPLPAAPVVRPPSVAAPEPAAPAIDAGWDELLGDAPSDPKP